MRDKRQINLRMDSQTVQHADYWSDAHDMTRNDYIVEAVEEKIARENKDYDLPTLEIQRLAQLADMVAGLRSEVQNLLKINLDMTKTIISLTRGDNYLIDAADEGDE